MPEYICSVGKGWGLRSVQNPVAFLAYGGFIPQGFPHAEVLTHPDTSLRDRVFVTNVFVTCRFEGELIGPLREG